MSKVGNEHIDDLMDLYRSRVFVETKDYAKKVKNLVVDIMSNYYYSVSDELAIKDNLVLEFNIETEIKNDDSWNCWVVKKDETNITYWRNDIIYLRPFIDTYNSVSDKLCIFLKVISLFPHCNKEEEQNIINRVKSVLKDFYEIKIDNNAEFGCHVCPKYNIEIIEANEQLTKQEPSLMVVLNKMHQLDYAGALQELSKILEPNRKKYEELFQNGDETLKIDTFFNFVNNYGIRHGKNKKENGKTIEQKEPTDEQLKVFLDFGLSIYRLFNIYQSENKK